MILRNDDLSQIAEITGLSLEKLYEIKAELSNDQMNLVAV